MKESLSIGVFLDNEEQESEVCSSLLAEGRLNPICFFTAEEFLKDCINARLDGAVIGVDENLPPNFFEIRTLINRLSPLPLIFLTDKKFAKWKSELRSCQNAHIIHSEQRTADLAGAVFRVVNQAQSAQRIDLRRKISMERAGFLSKQNRGTCLITDISSGGAGAIIHNDDLKAGDKIQLFFPISENFNFHSAHARVCWEAPFANDGGQLKRVGFEFTRVAAMAA